MSRLSGWPMYLFFGMLVVAAAFAFFGDGIASAYSAASGGSSRGGGMMPDGAGPRGGAFYSDYGGFRGSSFSSGWTDALNVHDILQEKIDSYNRKVQHYNFSNFKSWGGPSNECTSKETWTPRCAYHR